MALFEFDKIEDWRVRNECHPFEDGLGNICITVVSEYETPGSEKEKRLEEAKVDGVNKLLRFYGKAPATGPKTSDVSMVPLADRPINSTFDAPIQAVLDNAELPTNGDKIENSSSLYDYAFVYDYFVSYRPCAKMRVFVKIPKDYITSALDDIASCKIFKPDDGYLSAILSIENFERDIDYIVNSLEDFIPTLARSDKYISNLNIQKEFERLRKSKLAIQRYVNLNEILPEETINEECQTNLGSILELGYDYDYNLSFALVGNDSIYGGTDKYTIGYDCLLESSILNHPTTANYLLNLQEMALALTDQLNDNFDIFNFLSNFTFPTPVILTKNEPTDGLNKFDPSGNLSSFANLANLINFDLDLNACKTPEQLENENFIILDEETRASIADSARKTKKTYQAFSGDSDEMVKLRTTLGLPPSTDPPLISDVPEAWEFVEVPNALARELILGEPSRDSAFNLGLAEGLEEAFKYANEDILDLPEAVLKSKQDIAFFRGTWGMRYVEEAGLPPGVVKIYLNDNPNKFRLAILDSRKSEYYAWKREQRKITKEEAKEKLNILYADVMARLNIGCLLEETFECALEELIKLIGEKAFNDPELSEFFDVSNAFDGLGLCPQDDPCDGTRALKVGLPIFQGIEIPSNFPTTDYLAGIINAAIAQLYNTLVNAIVSFITGIITGICKLVSAIPDGVGELISDGFNSWLSNTIGINVSELRDPQAWADAVTSSGGQGFLGAIGTLVSRSEQSFIAAATDTGISFNLPNPTTGIVEEVLISPEFFYNVMSGVETATQELEVVLTPPELTSLYKGHASDDVLELAHRCLSRSPGGLFKSKEAVEDTFSSLGRIVSPDLLEVPPQEDTPIENICDLGDGTNQAILRKNFLSDKDPELSDIEIEAILDKEKNELLEKLKRTLEFINRFKSGTLFPSFPSIFGGSQSLIPETPPVIQATLSSVSAGLYSPVISNFNTAMTEYAPLYNTEINVTEDDQQAFVSLARELMDKDGDFLSFNPKMVAASVDISVVGPEDILTLGYTPRVGFNTETTVIEYFEEYRGRYEWTNGNFDSGKHSSDWWKDNQGPDDQLFKKLIEDAAGIRYVDLSEDDYTIYNTTNLVILVTVAALIVVSIIFPPAGVAIQGLALSLLKTIGLSGTIIGSSLIVYGGILGATIAITTLAAATLITLGTVALSYLLVKELIENSIELVVWAVTKYHELNSPTEEEFKEAIECAYNDGELNEAAYNELEPAAEELHEAISVANDTNQWAVIQAIADHLEDKDDENGTHTETFDISDFLVELDPANKTELILKSQVSGQWNPFKKDVFYTDVYIRKTPITQEVTELQRPEDFSEALTSFERKGVKAAGGYQTQPLYQQMLGNMSLTDLLGVGVDLVERNRVQRKISNYGIEYDSSIILGRKIALPGLLDYTFTSEIDVPDEQPSMPLLETWGNQKQNKHMQEYHIRLQEMFQELGFSEAETEDNSIIETYKLLLLECAKNIADRTSFNRLYLQEYIDALEFEYPKHDIMGFNKLQEDSVSLNESILQLDTTNEEYCDTLSSTRRSATITGVRMLIRAFVAERALNCIQIFDTFHTEFMTSELFAKAVFSDIKLEMNKYQSSFVDTLQGDLFSDIKAVAARYFEIQNLLGSDEPLPTTDKNAMIELIRQEIQDMYETLYVQLRLDSKYHSMTWDDFVFDVLLTPGTYSSGTDPETGEVREKEFGSVLGNFVITAKKNEPYEKNGEWIYGVELQYVGMTIVLAECVGTGAPAKDADGCDTAKTTGNYQKAKDTLFANEIYQNVVSYIFPLKDIISLFTVYNLSAISDPAVFSATYGGKHVTDLFSETKLSILQIFLSSLYGGTEAVYVDPFLEKLKT